MRRPSRLMPRPVCRQPSIAGWILLIFIFGALAYGLASVGMASWRNPAVSGFVIVCSVVIVAYSIYESTKRRLHLRDLAAQRPGESLCGFAREFDSKTVDTWVIRAVFEELQEHLKDIAPSGFPIRKTDRIDADLHIDIEDIEASATDIVSRMGRTLADSQTNPYFGRVKTVEDVVLFFNFQRLAPGAAGPWEQAGRLRPEP